MGDASARPFAGTFIRPGEQRVRLGEHGVYLVRAAFELDAVPDAAEIRATALGLYELSLNGAAVSDERLRPGWTDYTRRLPYQEYQVSSLLRPGRNVIGAWVAPGWYAGRIRLDRDALERPLVPEFLAELVARDASGAISTLVATDEAWEWTPSEILASDLYDGEVVDLRRAREGWSAPEAGDLGRWEGVDLAPGTAGRLVRAAGPPVRAVEIRHIDDVAWLEPGTAIVDTSRNDVGHLRLSVSLRPGTRIEIVHGELLDVDGRVYTENLRSARCIDEFTCAGTDGEILATRFSIRGFRYAEIRGLDGPASLRAAEKVVVSSDVPAVGRLDTSDALLTAIWENVATSQRANFIEVPTDCPQRDERLGWMADALLFAPLASFTHDIRHFMDKWLDDVLDARSPAGHFTDVAPRPSGRTMFRNREGAPAWADAGVLLPWLLYQRYGDPVVLERSYSAMAEWLEAVHAANPNGLWRHDRGRDYGDWVPAGPDTSHTLFSTCWLYRSTTVTARIAAMLDRNKDAARYEMLAERVRRAFNDAFVDEATGRIADPEPDSSPAAARRFAPTSEPETQTGYILAIVFDLVDGEKKALSCRRLVDLVIGAGRRLTTGFIGSALILDALERAGADDLALELLRRDEFPSLGYMVRRGATSIWERWDGILPSGGPACATMNSFNHYALSSMFSWAITGLCGLRPSEETPGFRRFGFAPVATSSLDHARFEFDSPAGRIETGWAWDGGDLVGRVRVPATASCAIASVARADGEDLSAIRPGDLDSSLGERSWPSHGGWWLAGPGEHEIRWRR